MGEMDEQLDNKENGLTGIVKMEVESKKPAGCGKSSLPLNHEKSRGL